MSKQAFLMQPQKMDEDNGEMLSRRILGGGGSGAPNGPNIPPLMPQ